MRLMCDLGLDYAAMSKLLGSISKSISPTRLNRSTTWKPTVCSCKTPAGLDVTDLGRLFIRNIAMRFDTLYATGRANRKIGFSRTI